MIICKITILFCIYLEMSCIPVMMQPLLQSLVLHDPQEIIFNMLIWSTKIISHNVINITLQCTVYIYSYIDGFIYLKNYLPLWDRNYVAVYFWQTARHCVTHSITYRIRQPLSLRETVSVTQASRAVVVLFFVFSSLWFNWAQGRGSPHPHIKSLSQALWILHLGIPDNLVMVNFPQKINCIRCFL